MACASEDPPSESAERSFDAREQALGPPDAVTSRNRDPPRGPRGEHGAAPLAIARNQHRPHRLAISGGRVFWTNRVAAATVQSAPVR